MLMCVCARVCVCSYVCVCGGGGGERFFGFISSLRGSLITNQLQVSHLDGSYWFCSIRFFRLKDIRIFILCHQVSF